MILSIPGLVVNIRKPEISDLDCLVRWLSSDAYGQNIGGPAQTGRWSCEQEAQQMLQHNANDLSPNKYYLAEDRFSGEPVALAMLCKIDWKNGHGEYSYIVGSEAHRAKLAAGDINVLMYNHFFNELRLNKVYGYVFASNAASLRMNAFGGCHEGTLRRHRLHERQRHDVHVFSITAREFAAFVERYADTLLKKHVERGLVLCKVR